jgi:thiazole synthase
LAITDTPFTIAGRSFSSRLIVGSGKYPSHAVMTQAIDASGAEIVTVAVRRVNLATRRWPAS